MLLSIISGKKLNLPRKKKNAYKYVGTSQESHLIKYMKNKVNPNISPLSQPKLEHNMIGH